MSENIENGSWRCACGTVSSGSFCSSCGQKKPMQSAQYCAKCGAPLQQDACFCKACGAPVGAGSESSGPSSPQQPQPAYSRSEAQYSQPALKPKKKKRGCLIAILAVIALFIVLAIANGGEFNFSTANVSQPAMASTVDSVTMQPINKTSVFTAQSPIIYATVYVQNAPTETKIKAKWTYVDSKIDIGTVSFQTTQTNQYVAFNLTRPNNGFPVGSYTVDIYLNDKLKETIKFTVNK
jgi:hypothetical protein